MKAVFFKLYCISALIIVLLLNYLFYRMLIRKHGLREIFGMVEINMECVSSSVLFLSLVTSFDNLVFTWNCIDDKCVKNELQTANEANFYNTLEICKLTCGQYGPIWPQPTKTIKLGKKIVPINPERITFDLTNVAENNEIINANGLMSDISSQFLTDLRKICHPNCVDVCDSKVFIRISTNSPETDITWDTDESYYLNVNSVVTETVVNIEANTIFGARHALQTLFQLITTLTKNNTFMFMISEAVINDKPAYPHRGLLIDTSRNYLKTTTIKRTLDGMGHSKLNVLHWHATDSHSFPLKLPRIPEMAKYGAYSAEKVYTLQDLTDIINYGKIRGVRIILEIDSPAHAGNGWQWGPAANLGELAVCVNQSPWRNYCIQPPCGQLNPINPNTYKILGQIYKDLVEVFPKKEVFHMGGDEIFFNCWNNTKEIVDRMEAEGLNRSNEDFLYIWARFHNQLLQVFDKIVQSTEIPIILWSSDLTDPIHINKYLNNKRFIIQTWLTASDPIPAKLLEMNYKLIVSTKDAWYLDHGFWGKTNYSKWSNVYDNRIPDFSEGVLGGEVCMWGELVDDYGIDSRIWPRASAAAERLWTNSPDSSKFALSRFLLQRERLVRLGINAATVTPEWCFQNDDDCS